MNLILPFITRPSVALRSLMIGAISTCVLAFSTTQALSQISQEPLLTRSQPVYPNFTFVMDDSLSMVYVYAGKAHYASTPIDALCAGDPTALARSGARTTTTLTVSGTSYIVSDPTGIYDRPYLDTVTPGTPITSTSSSFRYIYRSPANNSLYYNPAQSYTPRMTNSGASGVNASTNVAGTFTFYLPKAGFDVAASGRTRAQLCTRGNYIEYSIRRLTASSSIETKVDSGVWSASNQFPYSSSRSPDCGSACSATEEWQNIQNWNAYYTDRIGSAQTGLGFAFQNVPNTFRATWFTINTTTTTGVIPVVRNFEDARGSFYNWINSITPRAGGTPLRRALDVAGQYYLRTGKNGPWAHKPWLTDSEGEATTNHHSCRRSFSLLITDGEWNGDPAATSAARANVDGTNGPTITHANGKVTYQYRPGDTTDPRNQGKKDRASAAAGYTNTLADVAMYYWVNDLRDLANNVSAGGPNDPPFWQNMTTFTGSFGVAGKLTADQIERARAGSQDWQTALAGIGLQQNVDDLVHAAHNGGGEFLQLTNAQDFSSEINRVVSNIATQSQSQAGVAASAAVLNTGTKKYVPTFSTSSWWGNLKSISLKANGQDDFLQWEVIGTTNDQPNGTTTLPTPASRQIYAFKDNSNSPRLIPFTHANMSSQGLIASSVTNGMLNSSVTSAMVDYMRGVRSNEGNGTTNFRKREAVLGDIVNSNPVFVKNDIQYDYGNLPSTTSGASLWSAYKTAKAARTEGILLVGANDGMLHVFRESNGAEVLAVIPRSVLHNMHLLASQSYGHRYFVDGPLSHGDAYISVPVNNAEGATTGWNSIVLGTTGAGARSVFALNASNGPSTTWRSFMWEVNATTTNFGNLGHVLHEAQMGLMQNGEWAAIFNNGVDSATGQASLFIVNLSTGAVIREIVVDSGTGNGLGGVRLVRNSQGYVAGAYAGDLKGNIWRFDLTGSATSAWSASRLFQATEGSALGAVTQPITATPAVVPRTDGRPGNMVVVSTGRLYTTADQTNTRTQAAYGLWDTADFGSTSTVSEINANKSQLAQVSLQEQTNTTAFISSSTRLFNTTGERAINWTTDRGWFIQLTAFPGQRVVYSVETYGGLVFLDTIAPRPNDLPCTPGTSLGQEYRINIYSGLCSPWATLDINGDGEFTDSDSNACIYTTAADGKNVILRKGGSSSSVFSVSASGSVQTNTGHCGQASFSSSNPSICPPNPSPSGFRRDWRQLFMRK